MRILLFAFFVCLALMSSAQMDIIKLSNPSFEDTPRKGEQINGIKKWYDCGTINFPEESPPDIHPGDSWGVDMPPLDGKTYLGLVVRDNDSWESVSQKLSIPNRKGPALISGNCYTFSLSVARSEVYLSGSRFELQQNNDKSQTYNYSTPIVVMIWGGNGYCEKSELLGKSKPNTNPEWETIKLEFSPKEDCGAITIEAYYDVPVLKPYNGHVLIDNLSDIIQVKCED